VPSIPWGTGVAQIVFFALLALIFVNYLRKRNARQES